MNVTCTGFNKRGVQSATLLVLVALLFAGCNPPAAPPPPPSSAEAPQHLPTATIRVGDRPLVVEVARTTPEQAKGMMFRPRLGPDEAMLFVFDRDSNLKFWMKNTWVDLDLAYIDSAGRITQIERMKARLEEPVYSREPVRFVLEVPAGWFEGHGIKEGATLAIPAEVAKPGV